MNILEQIAEYPQEDILRIIPVPQEKQIAEYIWPLVEKHLKRAVDASYGQLSLEAARQNLIQGDYLLFLILDEQNECIAAVCAQRTRWEGGRVDLEIVLAGGSRRSEWVGRFLEFAEQIAYDNDCDGVQVSGRVGWQKILKPYGYALQHISLWKGVHNGQCTG